MRRWKMEKQSGEILALDARCGHADNARVINLLYQLFQKNMLNRLTTFQTFDHGANSIRAARRFVWPFGFGFYFYFSRSRGVVGSSA
jgi:hypothetical protein